MCPARHVKPTKFQTETVPFWGKNIQGTHALAGAMALYIGIVRTTLCHKVWLTQ